MHLVILIQHYIIVLTANINIDLWFICEIGHNILISMYIEIMIKPSVK